MDQLEQDIINAANIKLAGVAKGMLFSALGGATSGGLAGAGLGSLLGGTIGAVKNYRNSAGTFGNRLKAGLTGGLRGGAKGGLVGGGIGAGLGSSTALLLDNLDAKADVVHALQQIGRMRQHGYTNIGELSDSGRKLISYLEGLNRSGDNYKHKHLIDSIFGGYKADPDGSVWYRYGPELDTLKRDALAKAKELNYRGSPSDNFTVGGIYGLLGPLALLPGKTLRDTISNWRMEI